MDKISIIIPNYNCEKYIIKCLDSVINQDYSNKEIIIIDDGSQDNSINIINDYIKIHNKENIILICQKNMNAAIARNEGLKNASGKYLIFLDSDDELEKNILSTSISHLKKEKSDLLIGNYTVINQNNKILRENKMFSKNVNYIDNEIYKKLVMISPVPSNKIYNMDIIKKNNIYWGNVRIGQDLNFYLKYLCHCKKVSVINTFLYKYRIVENSISRSYDYRILDIVNSFKDTKKHYKNNNMLSCYDNYVQVLELKNYNCQIWKQINFPTYKERRMIVDYFSVQEKKINYKKCLNYNKELKKIRLKFNLKVIFKYVYTFPLTIHLLKHFKNKRG